MTLISSKRSQFISTIAGNGFGRTGIEDESEMIIALGALIGDYGSRSNKECLDYLR